MKAASIASSVRRGTKEEMPGLRSGVGAARRRARRLAGVRVLVQSLRSFPNGIRARGPAFHPDPITNPLRSPVLVRLMTLLLALALAHPALAQTAPPQPQAVPAPPPAKPAQKKPAPPKSGTASQPTAQSGPCIGVIPHIGDSFSVQRIGITVFGNEVKDVPIQPWGFDDVVVARVRAAAGPRFAVRRIAFGKDAFVPYEKPERTLFRDSEADLKAVVQKIGQGAGCERYVVVIKSYNQFSGTNQTVGGIGIVNYGVSGLDRTWLFALSYVVVYDGRTFAVLKKGTGGGDQNILVTAFKGDLRGPNRQLDKFAWPPAPEAVMGLRDSARSLLTESLDKGLPALLAP